ncbi:MAG TPA: hydroxysqualene dehydroxylase HpnE [Dehalococcoidia bacterium]|nr:hydroxysqualene dehydroxylase HpnE [Dehalococcoidia bacterium]
MAAGGVSGQPRVAIAGAGLAGLAAGVALQRAGVHVEMFERTRLLGGKATSFSVDGVEVDNGQHVVLGCCTEFLRFADGVGMRQVVRMQPRFEVRLLSRGRRPAQLVAAPLPAPLHLAPSFARYPLLTFTDKLRVGRALAAAARDPNPAGTVDGWLSAHGQSAACRSNFWDPFLIPALNAPLELVAARDGVFVIRTAFLSSRDAARIAWTTVPLARLAEAAARRLAAVHLRSTVTDVERRNDGATALIVDGGRRDDFDAVVLAVPPRRLAAVIGRAEPDLAAQAARFRTQPIVDVHLWYPADRPLLGAIGFAALLGSPVQWVFEKAPGYLCCSLSAASSTVTRSEPQLASLCHEELAAVLPRLRAVSPMRVAVTRDADATFVPEPGMRRPVAATSMRNLVIAGAWTDTGWPATMESAVRSGSAAAATLLQRLRTGGIAVAREYAHAV